MRIEPVTHCPQASGPLAAPATGTAARRAEKASRPTYTKEIYMAHFVKLTLAEPGIGAPFGESWVNANLILRLEEHTRTTIVRTADGGWFHVAETIPEIIALSKT